MSVVCGSAQRVHIEVEDEEFIYLVDPHRATRTQIVLQDLHSLIYGGKIADDALREAGQ